MASLFPYIPAEKRQGKEEIKANGAYEKEQMNALNNKLPTNFKLRSSVSRNNLTYLPSRLGGFFWGRWA
jgi:hypothetical protein